LSDILFGASLFLLGGDMTTDEIDLWVSIEQVLTLEEFRIFKMRHRWKMTQEQIAEEVGCKRRTIGDYLQRINEKIRQLL